MIAVSAVMCIPTSLADASICFRSGFGSPNSLTTPSLLSRTIAFPQDWFCGTIRATIDKSRPLRQEPLNLCPRRRQSEFGGGRPDTRNRGKALLAGMVFRLQGDWSASCCRPTERDSYTHRRSVATPHASTAQNVVARLAFFMLRLRYVMFPTMKAVFTAAVGALYREARPTALGQSQVGGTRL